MNNFKTKFILLFLTFVTITLAQESFRVMTYNLLNYPSKISSTRNPYFQTIISEIDPDIIVVQEIESLSGVELFNEQVLTSEYSAGDFNDGFDTDNAIFFKHSIFEFISNSPIHTTLRDIAQFELIYKNSLDTLRLFSIHLKAGNGYYDPQDEQQRGFEVNDLRKVTDELAANSDFLVLGDFNIYNTNEPAFKSLTDQTSNGYLIDPLNFTGEWHNNSNYSDIHTQSTRTANLPDDGSTGGLDDRFDMILMSQAIIDSGGIMYKYGSYSALGNDGNHFNLALNHLPNNIVSNELATALYYASDHLPVYADFEVQSITSYKTQQSIIPKTLLLNQNYPNPFNPTTTISYSIPAKSEINLSVYNALGEKVVELVNEIKNAGLYQVNFDASDFSSGFYISVLRMNQNILSKKMLLIK